MIISDFANALYVSLGSHDYTFLDLAILSAFFAPLTYLYLRDIIIQLISYLTKKQLYKAYKKESTFKEKLFFSKFKNILPKEVYLIHTIGMVILASFFLLGLFVHFADIQKGLLIAILYFDTVLLIVVSILKFIMLGSDRRGRKLRFENIYKKRPSKYKKRNKTRIRNPKKKK